MKFNKLSDLSVCGKTVLIRADLNVPFNQKGEISDDTRIRASLPSIRYCIENGASVIVMTHLGRPTEGQMKPEDDVAPLAAHLGNLLGQKVAVWDNLSEKPLLKKGEVILLQNVRINVGEKKNSDDLGKQYAALCDIYVNDAFGAAHRAQASTYAVARFAPQACAGFLMADELEALSRALENPQRPLVAIVAGSKVSTKLTILESLADKVDSLIVGGGIANTFLASQGINVGQSLCEQDLTEDALRVIRKIEAKGGTCPLPTDVKVAKEFSESAPAEEKSVHHLADDDRILDIGRASSEVLESMIQSAGTIVWNGPVGVFEFAQFAEGTQKLAQAIAQSNAFSIAGGGDTLAAIAQFGIADQMGYISTGGGAFLEFLEGKTLPAVEILEQRASV